MRVSRVPLRIAFGVAFGLPPAVVIPIGVPAGIPATFPAAVGLPNPVVIGPIIAMPPSCETAGSKRQEKKHSQRET